MTLKDISDKVGDKFDEVRTRVADSMNERADKLDQDAEEIREWEEENGRRHPKEVLREFFIPMGQRALFVGVVFMAASYGARYGVTRAVANGRLKVKKH